MPEFTERPPAREQAPTPTELMSAHGHGSAHTPAGCSGTARCKSWQDAHIADIMAVFWENPIVTRALADAEPDRTAAVVERAA